MHEILDILPKIWAAQRAKSREAVSAEGAKSDGSKGTSGKPKLNRVTRNYVKLIKSLHNIRARFTMENFTNTLKTLNAKEVTISSMVEEIYEKKNEECELSLLIISVAILIDIYTMCDDLNRAEKWCKMNQKFMKGMEEDPRYIILSIRTWHQLETIYADLQPQVCYAILNAALYLHKDYTKIENYPIPVAYDYLFTDKSDKNPDDILDSLQIFTIEKLIQLRSKSYTFDTYEFIAYMHDLLRTTVEEAVVQAGYIEWSITCANLAFYFMGRKRFRETRNHLITAVRVLIECNNTIVIAESEDENSECADVTRFSRYKQTLYSIHLIWMQYGIVLLRSSREKFVHGKIANNSREVDDSKLNSADLLLFDEISELAFQCHETNERVDFTSFPNQYLVNYDDAKKLYSNCWMRNYEVTSFFREQKDLYHLAEAALYFSRLCKYIAELEVDSSMDWHTTRLENLEYIVKETGVSTDPYIKRIRRILWLELGLAHCAYLEMEERLAIRTGENLSKTTAKTFYGPAKKILECFEAFRTKS